MHFYFFFWNLSLYCLRNYRSFQKYLICILQIYFNENWSKVFLCCTLEFILLRVCNTLEIFRLSKFFLCTFWFGGYSPSYFHENWSMNINCPVWPSLSLYFYKLFIDWIPYRCQGHKYNRGMQMVMFLSCRLTFFFLLLFQLSSST